MKLVGKDTFTLNTEGQWIDNGKTFVQYYGAEIRKHTNVQEIKGEELENLLKSNNWEDDGTKFYISKQVYSYTREEWDAELEGRR